MLDAANQRAEVLDTDALLLGRLHAGDVAAFELLFERHYATVFRALYGLTGSHEEAEDLAQETFLTLFRTPPRHKPGMSLAAWLCRVGLNRAYNRLRGARRERQRAERLAEAPAPAGPEEELARSEERALVRQALAKLPERQARLLLLRHAGLSYAEVAQALEIAPSSVGALLARAEKAFVAAYAAGNDDEPVL
ncbi:MAG: sigma-70 family RNA polymerase sigma factor [Chloroflexota bacterium]|nr:MAG: RNA polymerase subunit sigma-24 [Chloroflexota bacterium]